MIACPDIETWLSLSIDGMPTSSARTPDTWKSSLCIGASRARRTGSECPFCRVEFQLEEQVKAYEALEDDHAAVKEAREAASAKISEQAALYAGLESELAESRQVRSTAS